MLVKFVSEQSTSEDFVKVNSYLIKKSILYSFIYIFYLMMPLLLFLSLAIATPELGYKYKLTDTHEQVISE